MKTFHKTSVYVDDNLMLRTCEKLCNEQGHTIINVVYEEYLWQIISYTEDNVETENE